MRIAWAYSPSPGRAGSRDFNRQDSAAAARASARELAERDVADWQASHETRARSPQRHREAQPDGDDKVEPGERPAEQGPR